jgi:hypothetical protein
LGEVWNFRSPSERGSLGVRKASYGMARQGLVGSGTIGCGWVWFGPFLPLVSTAYLGCESTIWLGVAG